MVKKIDALLIKGKLKKDEVMNSLKSKSKKGVLNSLEIALIILVVIAVVIALKKSILDNVGKVNGKVDTTIDTIMQ